jgi:hypothetical protein
MRALVPVLIVANGLALAWWQGWLDPWVGVERQPQRLERQVRPETMQIIARPGRSGAPSEPGSSAVAPAPAAPTAPAVATEAQPASAPAAPVPAVTAAAPSVCLLVPARDAAQAETIEQQLAAGGVSFERTQKGATQGFVVYEPARASSAETQRRVEQLQSGGIRDVYVLQGGPYRLAISLGYFRSEATARVLLAQLAAKGFSGAQIGEVKAESGPIVFRASGKAAAIAKALAAASATPGEALSPCD